MAVNWTAEQLRAINQRGGTVLVSAAAGSGKTAVLVERVIRRITDEADPCSIEEFLIVTFTKAAAAEMKSKIADALTEKLLERPGDRRLRRQLTLLDRAQITTVHAFCTALLREHFQAAGLAPDFRVADENELEILQEAVLEELIEARYENDSPENSGFFLLVDALSAARDDTRLRSVILETYEKLQSHPYPKRWLAEMELQLERSTGEDPMDSRYGKILRGEIENRCTYALEKLQSAYRLMSGYPLVLAAYGPAYQQDIGNLTLLLEYLSQDWDTAAAFAGGISFARLSALRKFDDPVLLELIKGPREAWKKTFTAMQNDYFSFTREDFRQDMQAVLPYSKALFSIVAELSDRLDEEKRLRNILDFGDLEHLTVQILLDAAGEQPSPLARGLSYQYTEIMVDEYQDTNDVQDAIFQALSRNGQNLFLVGDMKQSIYRFRLANPEVFLRKYLHFSDDPAPGEPGRIILARNFRSRAQVTDAVNYIFENIMSPALGDIAYGEAEKLIPQASYPEGDGYDTELCLVEAEEDSELSAAEADARYVAARIREMLDAGYPVYDKATDALRPCVPEDFAILLRGVKGKAVLYESALAGQGISSLKDIGSSLFDSPDIVVLMSLIDVLDNPQQDVPLASVMRSPIYGFTVDDLAWIRIASKGTSFYGAVQQAALADDALGERLGHMLAQLDAFRLAAQDMPADRLILRILNETHLETLCSKLTDGAGKIQAFLEQAARFEKAGYCGLYRFAHMMRSLRNRGYEVAPTASSASAVHIMSIHKSKGLEFPIVFLANCASRFNMRDLTEPVLIHPELGPGFRRRQVERRIEYPTLPRLAIAIAARREALSEEERILYVAMTRAKEKLILTAPVKNALDTIKKYYPDAVQRPILPQALHGYAAYLPWVLLPLLQLPCAASLLAEAGIAPNLDDGILRSWQLRHIRTGQLPDTAATISAQSDKPSMDFPYTQDALYQRFAYAYSHPAVVNLPSKLTATALKGRYTDQEAAEEAAIPAVSPEASFQNPRFVQDSGLTGAERGTALHLVMQFIDFSLCNTLAGVAGEISRLASFEFITPEQAAAVNPRQILDFFHSPLGKRLMASPGLQREFKFSLLVPAIAAESTDALCRAPEAGEDTILFQGVIDCYFEEEGGLVVVDFKTDYVTPGGEGEIARRYRSQLSSYAAALARITGKPVKEKYLYLFRTNTPYPL